ncbi:hypothetical protein RvY_01404-2 [Ramazzottius varieornatus]|uniref:C2H2-type domain-containing protein n=1 Tax=Ramazzottius varieornatus TaxID=947166 RepID=A0A1D1UNB0_RAMVA|nr:hypothetical protein RvY_01404-2 [Ramazzottius varieornatus]
MAGTGGPGSPYGFPYQIPGGGPSFAPPFGLDARTAEAVRYNWEANRWMALAGQSSPIFGESLFGRLPPDLGRSAMHPAYGLSLYEQMYRLQQANSLRGLSIDGRAPLSQDYLRQAAALSVGTANDVLAGTSPNLGLPFGTDVSGLATPRPNPLSRMGRKRALSISPYPIGQDYDISAAMRMSPNSLISGGGNSRSSSSASNHALFAALQSGMNPAMAASMEAARLQHYMQMQQNAMLSSAFHPAGMSKTFHGMNRSTSNDGNHHDSQKDNHKREVNGMEVVSSSVTELRRKDRVKKEPRPSMADEDEDDEGHFNPSNRNDMEEDTFVETHCRWIGCDQEFSTQNELVAHVNQEHVPSNRKAYICRWLDCCREEKPFKAQYMLNVHMRRHTGEKPHVCKFPGCSKAYSRLENLKTHERSHTGERPYMCEFPGCTKAFSNASDRAKHQNRTHSNAKPYLCKVTGCTKRYTDPSSLRKHIKTVHGPEHFNNKKHKGNDVPRRNRDEEGGEQRRSEESHSGISGTGSSEPGTPRGNVKQEKMEMSPSYSLPPSVFSNCPLDSPSSVDYYLRDPVNMTANSRTNDPIEEESEMDIPEPEELPTVLHNAIYGPEAYGVQTASRVMRQPLSGPACPMKPPILMAPPQQAIPDRYGSSETISQQPVGPVNMSELSQRFNEMRTMMEPREQYFVPTTQDRRGSNASVSTYYSSIPSDSRTMSANPSRRVSTTSVVNYNDSQQSPPYDPISVGSSRRSSEPGLALSMTGYQQKMQMRQAGRWQQTPVPQPQAPPPPPSATPQYHGMRRASEPVGLMSQQQQVGQRVQPLTRRNLQRHTSLCMGRPQSTNNGFTNLTEEAHNDQMVLDEQENVLIPDDMVRYLNQVAEKARLQRESNPEDCSDDDTDLPVIHPNYDENYTACAVSEFSQSSAQHPYFAQQQPQRRSSYAYGSLPVNHQSNPSLPQVSPQGTTNFMTAQPQQQGRQRRGSLQVDVASGFNPRPLTEGSPDSYEVSSTTHSGRTPTQRRFSVNYTFQQEQHTASFVNQTVPGTNSHIQNTGLDVHSGMPHSLNLDERHRYFEMARS